MITAWVHLVSTFAASREITQLVGARFDALANALPDQLAGQYKNFATELQNEIVTSTTREHDLSLAFHSCGLLRLAGVRADVSEEIRQRLRTAQSEILMLGVALVDDVAMHENAQVLSERLAKDVDVRVLVLDPLRGAAVFRSLVETDPLEIGHVINFTGSAPGQPSEKHPYFDLPLYQRFKRSFTELSRPRPGYAELRKKVRYYGTAPTCWMICVDGRVYYQPYLFTREGPQRSADDRVPDPMPVFVFGDDPRAPRNVYRDLREHFEVLWHTSTVDHSLMAARKEAGQDIVARLFDERRYWLDTMRRSLVGADDRRRSLRHPCACRDRIVKARWTSEGGRGEGASSASVIDYGAGGLALHFEAPAPAVGSEVSLQLLPLTSENIPSRMAKKFVNQLIGRSRNEFVIVRVDKTSEPLTAVWHTGVLEAAHPPPPTIESYDRVVCIPKDDYMLRDVASNN